MQRRNTELLLMLAATLVLALLYALAILGNSQGFNNQAFVVPIGLAMVFLAAHMAVRRLAPAADPAILPIVYLLSGIGIAFVLRLAPSLAGRQMVWLLLSVGAMLAVLWLVDSITRLTDYKYTLMILGLVLLLLPAVLGTDIYGSKIWLRFLGFSFQPGEIAKVLVVLFLAGYLAENREMLSAASRSVFGFRIPDARALFPLLLMWAISLVIVVFERDLGSALLFFGIFLAMVYITTGRLVYVVGGVLLAALGCFAAFRLFGHVQVRVAVWLDPFAYRNGGGYQLIQALYSLADGAMTGTGIGHGMPYFIPVVASDFIFVAIAEETGFLGAGGLLLLYLLLAVRGLSIAARARSDVDAFAAVGFTVAIVLQAFVIVGGTTRLIPMTGVTLPFISQGGSSLLASFIIVGFLLRAGDSGTGTQSEMIGVPGFEGGILGRLALARRLTFSTAMIAALFALLIANISYYMIFQAKTLVADPANSHSITRYLNAPRGTIVSADGVILAESRPREQGEGWSRVYPQGSLAAHVVGYRSATYGAAGVEARYAESLAGRQGFADFGDLWAAATNQPARVNDVHLTLNSRIQRACEEALDGRYGAAVVINARTGEVLGLASSPGYDPADIDSILSETGDDGSGPGGGSSQLFNRATQALYAPGSTFKTVTLCAALQSGIASLDRSYDAPPRITIGGADITNFHLNDYGNVSLRRAFELSSNTVFAQVAEQLGASRLVSEASGFGFNQKLQTDFDVAMSLMPNPDEMTAWETAWAGIGQPVGEHKSPAGPQATVLQMAMVASALANDGVLMRPYLVDRVTSSQGFLVQQNNPGSLGRVLSPDVAAQMQTACAGVVSQGTGTAAWIDGYTVRGKTGTAQTSNRLEDSWFIGWVEIGDQRYVVAIVQEQQPTGEAVPYAREILETVIEVYGP